MHLKFLIGITLKRVDCSKCREYGIDYVLMLRKILTNVYKKCYNI